MDEVDSPRLGGTGQGEHMRINLVRSIGIVFGIIPILLVAPTICAASMDMPPMAQHSGSLQEGAAIPERVSISASPLSHHILLSTLDEQTPPNRLIPSEAFCLSWSPADLTVEPSPTAERPVQGDARDLAPPSKPIAYHCRNYLTSEEPPL